MTWKPELFISEKEMEQQEGVKSLNPPVVMLPQR